MVKRRATAPQVAGHNSGRVRTRAQRMSPEARKAQLLANAIVIFADKGIGNGVHSDLAELTGVSVPTVFHYFPTREALVAAVLGEIQRFLLDDLVATHLDPRLDAAASVEDLLMTFCDAIDTHQDYIRIWLEWSVSIRCELWTSYLGFYQRAIVGVKQIITRGREDGSVAGDLDVEDAARVIVGVAHMVAQMKFAHSSRDTIQHTIHSLVSGYLANRA